MGKGGVIEEVWGGAAKRLLGCLSIKQQKAKCDSMEKFLND